MDIGSDPGAAGVVVRRRLPTAPAVRGSASLFLTEVGAQGLEVGRTMLSVGVEPAPPGVAAALGLPAGAEVIARRKLLLADAVPVRVATSFLPGDLFAGTRLAAPGFVEPSLQQAISALGHVFGHAVETLVARRPTAAERRWLDLAGDEWVVRILRTSHDRDGRPVHALETVCAADRHVFDVAQTDAADEF